MAPSFRETLVFLPLRDTVRANETRPLLSYAGHVLMENRNGIAVNGQVTPADGRTEPQAASAMVEEIPGRHRVTLGADKGYDSKEFVQELRDHQVTPHLACKPTSIIDDRTTRHPGYAIISRNVNG